MAVGFRMQPAFMRFLTLYFAVVLLWQALIDRPLVAGETFILGTSEWEPITGEQLPNMRLGTEIVQTAIETAGHRVEVRFMPWRRCEDQLKAGIIDAIFSYSQTTERQEKHTFSKPIVHSHTRFYH